MKFYHVYVNGKIINKCYIKYAKNKNEARRFFENLGYNVLSVIKNNHNGNKIGSI